MPSQCKFCRAPERMHGTGLIKHDYTPEGTGEEVSTASVETAARVRAMVAGSIDPVLRQALIDKNILTPKDLSDAESKIVAVSAGPQVTKMQKAPRAV